MTPVHSRQGVGSLRIVEIEGGFGGPGWTWRYRVEKLFDGGRFLFWSWGPDWKTVADSLTHSDAQAYIDREGRYERVVAVYEPAALSTYRQTKEDTV